MYIIESISHHILNISILFFFFPLATDVLASGYIEKEVGFEYRVAEIDGALTLPRHDHSVQEETILDKVPRVEIVGGSFSHTRDVQFVRDGAPMRDALKQLTHSLGESGYASL
ncbi:MAG: hypothetical protein GWN55_11625 [Phycisphaerae bacterium]|nr:hypothetical protein [Phycisphaerae bacterium]NIV01948.1 hypothetical protein [Phycisphaerae bacterium]NIV70694.1 hypothetical protein [Phycisphaerae bacterium]NIX02077.1 hypothetical protein [Phycisphaerae bacterium]